MTDEQKASSLPMYDNPAVRTENLQEFCKDAMLFKNAFTSCPICIPARVSMFTGQYPSAHGALDNSRLMKPGKNHLLKIIKEAGMETGLAGKNHCFTDEDLQFFDYNSPCSHIGPQNESCDSPFKKSTEYLKNCPELKAAWGWTVNPNPPEHLGTAWTTDRAIDFIRDNIEGNADAHVVEVLRDMVHGMLHLVGYTHKEYLSEDNQSSEPMYQEQERLLNELTSKLIARQRTIS